MQITSVFPNDRRRLFAIFLLAILHSGVWILKDLVIDGQTIAVVLTASTIITGALLLAIANRLPRFAGIGLGALIFIHLLFYILFVIERRFV
jgi:hypothetical protein